MCTSAGAQNFGEGTGHTGNDVTYTRSHIGSLIWFECMTYFGQYMHGKHHNAVFSINNTEKFSWVVAMGLQMEEFWKKQITRITISEHKECFNESYAEWYLLTLVILFNPIGLTTLSRGFI